MNKAFTHELVMFVKRVCLTTLTSEVAAVFLIMIIVSFRAATYFRMLYYFILFGAFAYIAFLIAKPIFYQKWSVFSYR